jgi:hypothetical protein
MAITTAELFWIRMLFQELRFPLSFAPVLWCDNVSALALASNPIFHARTKHIEVDYHFICEKVVNGDILVKFISTLDQVVDIFTKGLSFVRFAVLKSKLMVLPSHISLRGDVKLLATNQVESDHTLPNQAPITHADHSLVKSDNQYSPTKVSIHARQVPLSLDRLNKARKECSASCHTGKESQGCT